MARIPLALPFYLSAHFPMENNGYIPSVFIQYECDGCTLSFKSNPTWLSFSTDGIRVYWKGWGLGVCTSDFLAKPGNPGDGVRRITVSASPGGGVTASEIWTLFKCLCFADFNEGMWSKALSLNNLYFTPWIPLLRAHVMSWLRVLHLPWKPWQRHVRVRKRSQTGCVKNSSFTAFSSPVCFCLRVTCISYLVYSISPSHWSGGAIPLRPWPGSMYHSL